MRKKFPIKAIISICCVALIIIVGVVLIVNNSFQPEDSQERDLSELAFDNLDMDAPVGLVSTLRLKMMILSFSTETRLYLAMIYQRKKSRSPSILLKYPGRLEQFKEVLGHVCVFLRMVKI